MLCQFCANLDFDEAASVAGAPHHRTYAELVDCADSGCELCREIEEQNNSTENEGLRITCNFYPPGQILCWLQWRQESHAPIATLDVSTIDGMINSCIEFDVHFLTIITGDEMAEIVWARPIHRDVKSPEFSNFLCRWMNECKSDRHPNCSQTDEMTLPKSD